MDDKGNKMSNNEMTEVKRDEIEFDEGGKLASEIRKELDRYGYRLDDNVEEAVKACIRHDREIPEDPIVLHFVERLLQDALKTLLAAQHDHFRTIVEKLLP